ncbi:MAG: DUF5052 family protein [Ruminococcus flavefaciens]|nr:DUF5052 family protein [Ruminococcus flavefaciens]MCM1059266.1 DUF5052 family protein [Eubacterium sp.]
MKVKNIVCAIACFAAVTSFTGCIPMDNSVHMSNEKNSENIVLTYEAMMYDNTGNNYVTFKGNSFNITPNKTKQWGYNSNGSWSSWYETSSVVSIEIDGHYIQSCGSTIIFKDSRLEITPLETEIGVLDSSNQSGYSVDIPADNFKNYFALTNWWYDLHENGQGGAKAVLIQSQDGYNIGVIEGNEVTWEVAEKLPKTTLIKIDGMPLYIHRCNFSIIDTALFDSVT